MRSGGQPSQRKSWVRGSKSSQENMTVFVRQNGRISDQLDQGNPG